MVTKKTIIVGVGLVLIILLGLILFGSNTNKVNPKKSGLVDLSSFCDINYKPQNYKPMFIDECDYNNSKVYSVSYGAVDLPSYYYDSNKNFLFQSGGMPLPNTGVSPLEPGINCIKDRRYNC